METVLDSEGIKRLLPHRYPFLLVDRIIELKPLERIVGIKQVSVNESFFEGHFPGAPVMPGVLVIEALAQCGAILALREIEDRNQKLVLFTGIKEARFRRPVVPGDTLTLEGYQASQGKDAITVTVYWRVKVKPTGDYTIFIHAEHLVLLA